ncbi:coiled-coil alpha-helical rod protein 1 isoform X8 [Dasypus novemcinctus]|uniref:coiled-coil alpha-helical rod protein 1 isoform X8 n=1 Tax=Dasypus novemcinctus TaxID=9361 RepID=UPI0039C9FB2B
MWARPSAARPWASAFLAKEPGAVAWWCLEGLPRGLAEPWRELWGSGPQPPRPAPQECGTIGEPGNLRRGIMDSWRQTLEPSHTAGMFRPSGSTRLIPPSHFQARPFPPVPRLAPTWVSDSPPVQSPAHQEVPERRLDNQRLQVGMWERAAPGDGQEPARRDRSLDLQGSQALSQQAELIFRQLQELRRLEEEVRLLRETSLQQKKRLEAQALELEALAQAEKAGRAEAEGLRAALAGAELVRKNLEEGSQRELEEVRRLHQEQLSRLMEAHQEALSSLTSKAEGLEKSLSSLEARKAEDVEELAMARKEAELLQKQLSKTQEDLEAQVALVATLRNYVGEQVPPEAHSQPWELERQELLNTLQHVQEDRDALRSTAELLQVRVQSLACILALQEEDLAREAHPADPLEPECVRKVQSLLSCWREKVFALMVQLKAQDLAHQQRVGQLKAQVAGLEGRVASQSQKEAVLQRALQDKAAQVEMERMGAKALQGELSRAQEARLRQQQQAAAAEEQLRLVVDSVSSSQVWLLSTVAKVDEAASRIPSLSARLSYATRRVLTIQGLMARKVALAQLRQERREPRVAAAAGRAQPPGCRAAAECPPHPAGGGPGPGARGGRAAAAERGGPAAGAGAAAGPGVPGQRGAAAGGGAPRPAGEHSGGRQPPARADPAAGDLRERWGRGCHCGAGLWARRPPTCLPPSPAGEGDGGGDAAAGTAVRNGEEAERGSEGAHQGRGLPAPDPAQICPGKGAEPGAQAPAGRGPEGGGAAADPAPAGAGEGQEPHAAAAVGSSPFPAGQEDAGPQPQASRVPSHGG